jgi:hypothetical protein
MCLNPHTGKLIAKKDLYVLKVLRKNLAWSSEKRDFVSTGTYMSPFRGFNYELGKVYKLRRPIRPRQGGTIDYGYHAYVASALYNKGTDLPFHLGQTTAVMLCRIPKGSVYYRGSIDIASNQIEIIEPLLVGDNSLDEKIPVNRLSGKGDWLAYLQLLCLSQGTPLL